MTDGKKRYTPQRTCIVCGRKRAKGELLRLALDAESKVQFDRGQRYSGRGAYICIGPDCLTRVKMSRLRKAFRRSLPESAWNPALAMAEALKGDCSRSYDE
ncbi:MAG: YlxR family protein [Deltaproteobacteria bacterium]|nr:MAG: YlxR family protein [Deltaproteobacteria bacterium]